MKRTAILGFGNPVRADDGVGCRVIDLLKQRIDPLPDFLSLIDMGTSAFEVLFQLQGHERIILVDAVINSGDPAGTLYHLPASEAMSAIQDDPMVFLHSLKWDQALSYAKKIMQDAFPEDISVYLIAIDDTRLELGISDTVLAAAEKVCELIQTQLNAFSAA